MFGKQKTDILLKVNEVTDFVRDFCVTMHSLLIFVVFGCFMMQTLGRPQLAESNERSDEEVEYESGGDGPDAESLRDDESAQGNEEESEVVDQDEEIALQNQRLNDDSSEFRHSMAANYPIKVKGDGGDTFSEYKARRAPNEKPDLLNADKEYQSLLEHRQPRFKENELPSDEGKKQHLSNRDVSNMKSLQDTDTIASKKVAIQNVAKEKGDILFENYDDSRDASSVTARKYNNVPLSLNDQSRFFKQYNNLQVARDDARRNNLYYANRERRQADDSTQKDNMNILRTPGETEPVAVEDEEAAIRRHVRKLSNEELQELLNSLTEDKRNLLKKIMNADSEDNKNMVNKREITKKAGTVEENSLVDLVQVESNKFGQGSPAFDLTMGAEPTPASASEINTQQEASSEAPDIAGTKAVETSALLNSDTEVKSYQSLSSAAPENPSILVQGTLKTENKREANLNDLSNFDMPAFDDSPKDSQEIPNQRYFFRQDDDLTQLTDDEGRPHNKNFEVYKREALLDNETEVSDSIRSLEESFPNADAYDDGGPYSGSNLAPLVRVKRRNVDVSIKKRGVDLVPDAKVSFFPYRAENVDEDSDEGNEFEDDGFYDPSSSLRKSRSNEKFENERPNYDTAVENQKPSKSVSDINYINKQPENENLDTDTMNENTDTDTMNLGSDSDNVLSGVEGVDDNVMFSSGSRSRRKANEISKTKENVPGDAELKLNRLQRSTPFMDDANTPDSDMNAPKYQESDAFGPLPRNYEGELSRYKRIRRVKQPPQEESAPTA